MRGSSQAALGAFREAFTGATIRTLAGIKDAGSAFLARVKSPDGSPHYDTTGDQDVWVDVVDEMTGMPYKARLHIPANILFALPEQDTTCLVVQPRDANGPGCAYAIVGDGGDSQSFPSWIASKVGLFTKKLLRLESNADHVELQAGSGKDIALNVAGGRGLKAARVTDPVNIGTLTATAGPYPVSFVFVPATADGPSSGSSSGPSITLTAVVSNRGGAEHVKA
jgi:hypothetical protein